MGAKLSAYLRTKKTSLRAVCRPPRPILPLPVPPLLLQPQELLDLICSHLSPASVCCLAITCKTTFSSLSCELGTQADRASFLCLLECDVAERFFFCPGCTRLHRWEKWWAPTNYDKYGARIDLCSKMDWARECFSPRLYGQYELGYQHFRLVTNRHYYGANKGLPLQNLEATFSVKTSSSGCTRWRQTWSARIIDNELFLRAHHRIQAPDEAALRGALDGAYLNEANIKRYYLCHHVCIASEELMARFPVLFIRPEPLGNRGPWAACRNVPGSCKKCLTDYVVTIETPDTCNSGAWRLSVTTYHQLGDGRSPEDWKWKTIKSPAGVSRDYAKNEWRRHKQRDAQIYPPGLVMETWELPQEHED